MYLSLGAKRIEGSFVLHDVEEVLTRTQISVSGVSQGVRETSVQE